MIFAWFCIIVGAIVAATGVYLLATIKKRDKFDRSLFLTGGITTLVIGLAMGFGSSFWLYQTEGGARAQKTWQSETGGGLTRVVTVYDMQGDRIAQYEGSFDVDANESRIIFDMPQEDGSYKRVQIWSSTGTVTIEER